jgi:hypothetical protein
LNLRYAEATKLVGNEVYYLVLKKTIQSRKFINHLPLPLNN